MEKNETIKQLMGTINSTGKGSQKWFLSPSERKFPQTIKLR
jgi:hypothetical protein